MPDFSIHNEADGRAAHTESPRKGALLQTKAMGSTDLSNKLTIQLDGISQTGCGQIIAMAIPTAPLRCMLSRGRRDPKFTCQQAVRFATERTPSKVRYLFECELGSVVLLSAPKAHSMPLPIGIGFLQTPLAGRILHVGNMIAAKEMVRPHARSLRICILTGECWEWVGRRLVNGYGQVGLRRARWLTHRFVAQFVLGWAIDDILVCHHCDNPPLSEMNHPDEGSTNSGSLCQL